MINVEKLKSYLVYHLRPPKSDLPIFETKDILELNIHKILYDSKDCVGGIIDASFSVYNNEYKGVERYSSDYSIHDYSNYINTILRKKKLDSL
jgi:hypothetical protein